MSHPFGDLLSQHLHRKHGLSQSKLAAGILQEPAIITRMCKGERLTGPQARERVIAIVGWLHTQGALETSAEANALLMAAGLAPLYEMDPAEATLLHKLNMALPQTSRTHVSAHVSLPIRPIRRIHLPTATTPFVGRKDDLATIDRHLSDPRCRILTLVGPGGVGKTRLAMEAASARVDAYTHGVFFVDLQAIPDAESLAFAIADGLDMALSGSDTPQKQLENLLANKHLLLVLDNFEQLLAGAMALSSLVAAAPQMQLLITSREVLNLSEEWQYWVNGIAYPPKGRPQSETELAEYDAVRLFVDCARRVQPAFAFAHTGPEVVRVCQLTEGMPLAIEMAATWTKTLPCAEIAHELERSLAFLSSRLRNAPPRHKSMEAAFEHSWRMLSAPERTIFARLSAFSGGFTREAAAQVAGAGLADLSSLVDKSFLHSLPNGRYKIHELLRQYGEERLAESPEDQTQTHARHGRYYAAFLSDQARPHIPEHQLTALPICRAETDNLRAAWRWAVHNCDLDAICKSAASYYWLAQYGCNYLEGFNSLQSATSRLMQEPESAAVAVAQVEVLPYLAWLALRLGRLEECEAACKKCLLLQQQYGILPQFNWGNGSTTILSIVAAIRGDYTQAEKLAQEERAFVRKSGQSLNMPVACYAFANAVLAQGRANEARLAILEAIDLCHRYQQRWFLAYCLNTLGSIEVTQGQLESARAHYQTAYELRELFDDAEGMALALNNLGEIAVFLCDGALAQRRYERGAELYRDLNDRGGLATSLKGLGDAACLRGEFARAQTHYRKALEAAQAMNYVSLLLRLLLAIAELFMQTQRPAWGTPLLMLVWQHPGSDTISSSRAHDKLNLLGALDTPAASIPDWHAALVAACEKVNLQLKAVNEPEQLI